jgi:N6-L-threonylcarbamoyladenine synthase
MKILSIETSCDDTCVAIMEISGKKKPHFRVLANIISSQSEIHKKWGGVYPTMAKREHQKNLVSVLIEALNKAKLLKKAKNNLDKRKIIVIKKILEREEPLYERLIKFLNLYEKPEIDALAVTVGPGLEPCLWSGINLAKALSFCWNLPIIPVNHIEAHVFSNWLEILNEKKKVKFLAVCLVASGGNTLLFLMKAIGHYKILGETRDDAAGECFDKVARILGLGYPGGPIIERKADGKIKTRLPRPMINTKDYDFSFSGLKTAVLYNFKKQSENNKKSEKYIRAICKETQQAIIDVLLNKTKKAAKYFGAKTIILGGGVISNKELRKQFKNAFLKEKIDLLLPEPKISTDNALMVAIAAYFHRFKKKSWKEIVANANQRI